MIAWQFIVVLMYVDDWLSWMCMHNCLTYTRNVNIFNQICDNNDIVRLCTCRQYVHLCIVDECIRWFKAMNMQSIYKFISVLYFFLWFFFSNLCALPSVKLSTLSKALVLCRVPDFRHSAKLIFLIFLKKVCRVPISTLGKRFAECLTEDTRQSMVYRRFVCR